MSVRKKFSYALALAVCLFGFGASVFAQASPAAPTNPDDSAIKTEIPIPLATQVEGYSNGKVADLANYIGVVYQFLISIIGLVAATMMIIGGFQYLTSAGDSSKIGAAKKRITDAMIGLVLALGAYALLNTINPQLLQFKPIGAEISKNSVQTVISVLPWCEDLAAKGTAVKRFDYKTGQYYGGTDPKFNGDCGSVGQYGDEKNPLYCIFRGDVTPCAPDTRGITITTSYAGFSGSDKTVTVPRVCFPQPLFSKEFINQRMIDFKSGKTGDASYCSSGGGGRDAQGVLHCDNPTALVTQSGILSPPPLAFCGNCADLEFYFEPTKFDPQGAYPNPDICTLFQTLANEGPFDSTAGQRTKKSLGKQFVQYCQYDSDIKGCASGIIECKPPADGSCNDYNQQPLYYDALHEIDGKVQTTYGWWVQGDSKQGVLASQPAHLKNVCDVNPCGYNGSKGCTGSGGIVDGIRTVARAIDSGILGYQSCDTK